MSARRAKTIHERQLEQQLHWTPPTRRDRHEIHTNESESMVPRIPSRCHANGYDDETPKNDGFGTLDGTHLIDGEKSVSSVCLSGASIRLFASCNTSVISDRVIRRSSRSALSRDRAFDLPLLQRIYTRMDTQKNVKPIVAGISPINVSHSSHKREFITKAPRIFPPILDIRFSPDCCIMGRMGTSFMGSRERMSRILRTAMKVDICSGISGWHKMRGSSRIRSAGRRHNNCFARSTSSRCSSASFLITKTASSAKTATETRTVRESSVSTSDNLASFLRSEPTADSFRDAYQNKRMLTMSINLPA